VRIFKILAFLITFDIVAFSFSYSQRLISQNEAESVAYKWIRKASKDTITTKKIGKITKDKLLYYVDFQDNSSVIVSSIKGVMQIVAYSKNRTLTEENLSLPEKNGLNV